MVTRYGCWRGEFFEGYEPASRESRVQFRPVQPGSNPRRVKRGEPPLAAGRNKPAPSAWRKPSRW